MAADERLTCGCPASADDAANVYIEDYDPQRAYCWTHGDVWFVDPKRPTTYDEWVAAASDADEAEGTRHDGE